MSPSCRRWLWRLSLEFKKAADLCLCQEFIWYNPAKLPTPAQWVTIERIQDQGRLLPRYPLLVPTARPKADNRRVLVPYSSSMKSLLRRQKYNSGTRPSEHVINESSFLVDNGGAIPPNVILEGFPDNVISGSNTESGDAYHSYCSAHIS